MRSISWRGCRPNSNKNGENPVVSLHVVICMDDFIYVIFPSRLFVLGECKHIQQSSIKAFHLPISLRMVRRSTTMVNAAQLFQPSKKTVSLHPGHDVYFRRKSKTKDVIVIKFSTTVFAHLLRASGMLVRTE